MERPFALPEQGHYHLHVHTISKLKNQCTLAAAAYRRAERFEQSVAHAAAYRRAQQLGNDGAVFDYRRKIGVAWTGILAPGFTPKELLDAQTLWNTVERIENRKNARLAREMVIALPHQVDLETHVAMLRAFVTANLVKRGMVADIAIHRPPVEHGGDPRNWHAHVLLTDRPMTPTGFADKKDRTWNAKENILAWRKAWADTHNATMEALGLPHRIDHRSLEAQRADALQRGDTIAALELDRTPQIHVGKASYGTHPRHTIFRDRRERNHQILEGNKETARLRHEAMRRTIARADEAAYLEARQNAILNDTWEPEPASYDDLCNTYGRPPSTSRLGRLKDRAFDGDVTRKALALSRQYGHPWSRNGNRAHAPSLLGLLLPMVQETGPGHPVFRVTAKDLAFCFYHLGILSLRQLQTNLEAVTREEQRRFADRMAKQRKPLISITERKPPKFPTPKADHLTRLQRFAPIPSLIYAQRVEQVEAFERRHERRRQQQIAAQSLAIRRARRIGPADVPPSTA